MHNKSCGFACLPGELPQATFHDSKGMLRVSYVILFFKYYFRIVVSVGVFLGVGGQGEIFFFFFVTI